MYRIVVELSDGTELEIRRRAPITPTVVDTTYEPLDEESGIRPALARCAPEPRLTTRARMRGHLRRVA